MLIYKGSIQFGEAINLLSHVTIVISQKNSKKFCKFYSICLHIHTANNKKQNMYIQIISNEEKLLPKDCYFTGQCL